MRTFLRRYTQLPYLIDYLATKKLALPDPDKWDDQNDTHFIREYKKRSQFQSAYALCLTEHYETYHHWHIYAGKAGGVCISFNSDLFEKAVAAVSGLRKKRVKYYTIEEMKKQKLEQDQYPFIKRVPFADEKEIRLFFASNDKQKSVTCISVPIACVERITLNPWMPTSVADSVKKAIKLLPGCSKLKVYRSQLIDNDQWKKLTK